LYWYRHAVARGHLDAQYRITELAESDHDTAEQQRLQLLIQNAEQGHANSQYQLAQYYLADGAAQDLSLGIHYLFLAAQQDHLAGQSGYCRSLCKWQSLAQRSTAGFEFH
jgi:hypothetical protein